MRRRTISALALAGIGLLAAPALGASNQVSICHATGSTTNPYVLIHPAAAGVVNGHLGHQEARDVIPPFTYKGVTYSQNWNPAGQELFSAGCKPVTTPPGDGGGGGSF